LMADNNFRAYRGRDGVARDEIDANAPDSVRDPLAELARLIGQADPAAEYDREPALQYEDAAPVAPGQNWAAEETYQEPPQYAEQGYEQPADPHPALRDYPSYQDNPPQPRFDDRYSEQPNHYDQAPRHEPAYDDRYAEDELPPLPRGPQLPALAPQQSYEDEYQDEGQWPDEHGDQAYATDERGRAYAADEYEEEADRAPRRSGLILVLGVIGLATIGAASAFAYREMFGGALIPSLPPIIKASDGPNKIVPAQAGNPNGADASGGSSAEKLVPREEQPVAIQSQNAPPRVVATIPVVPQQSSAATGAPPTALGAQVGAQPGAQVFPPPPGPSASPAPGTTSGSTEPKKVHTVLIKPEQPGSAAPAAQAPPARANAPTALAPRAAPAPRTVPPSNPNAPLALVPTAEGNTPRAAPHTQVARAEPGAGAPLSTSPAAASSGSSLGGGYSVQVTSQRSEAEAQSAYKELQGKFPAQLGSHHATIHRADLGEKGTYYRALIGPYSSAESAAAICSSLKAAGGSCIVQKN
jgi:SPOR domain